MEVEIKRRTKGLGNYTPRKSEEEKQLPPRGNLLQRYDNFLTFADSGGEPLTPDDLQSLFLAITPYEDHEYFGETWKFMTKLIQQSYRAGFNDFKFKTKGMPEIDLLFSDLHGGEENNLKLQVQGPLAQGSFSECSYVETEVYGSCDEKFGQVCRNSKFTLVGFIRDHHKEFSLGSTNCTYLTTHPEVLTMLLKGVRRKEWSEIEQERVLTGNKIVFINEQGDEELIRDYGSSS